ncbi:hypothetical protein F4815DRAFT_484218 [Daldinia loculata]|nr:hypothetical protein F4815DRAFT_484218 [Daldinia loculata]
MSIPLFQSAIIVNIYGAICGRKWVKVANNEFIFGACTILPWISTYIGGSLYYWYLAPNG